MKLSKLNVKIIFYFHKTTETHGDLEHQGHEIINSEN